MIRVCDKFFKVSRIVDVTKRKRLFCIFDKELPYELRIIYEKPKNFNIVNPLLFTNGCSGISAGSYCDLETIYEFRMTKEQIEEEYKKLKTVLKCYEEKRLKQEEEDILNEKNLQSSPKRG